MKILYIARESGTKKTGASQVMARNLEALRTIVGKENVAEYYFPKTNAKNVAISLIQGGSYGVTKREETAVMRIARELLPDFVFLESSCFGSLYKQMAKIKSKTMCFAHNLDTALCRQEISSRSVLVGLLKYWSTRFNERRTVKYADVLICLNQRDSDGFMRMFGREADLILPITFNKRGLAMPSLSHPALQPYCLFVGSDFFPNVEGIKWFIQNVATQVRTHFRIVGSCCDNPDLKVLTLPHNVEMVGYAENLEEEYLNASGVIAPIFKGSGMKTKTIEALSYGKSVFGTSEAFAGIECDFTRIGALCNTADEFVKVLHSTDLNNTVNNYSLEIFSRNFSDEVFIEQLRGFLTQS